MRDMVALSKATEIIAARKRLMILSCLIAGQTKFNELKRECGVSSAELSRSLNFLKNKGLVTKIYSDTNGIEYGLTSIGKEFDKVLYTLEKWGRKL